MFAPIILKRSAQPSLEASALAADGFAAA